MSEAPAVNTAPRKGEAYIYRHGEKFYASVYNLSRYAHVREARLPVDRFAAVWLGDEIAGYIRRERRKNRGRGCWRWIGYAWSLPGKPGDEVRDTISTDKMATARAVAAAYLQERVVP